MTVSTRREWKEGELDSPDASFGGETGAMHWYKDAQAIRILNPTTGTDVVVPEELFNDFLNQLDAANYEWIEDIRESAHSDGHDKGYEEGLADAEHDDA